MSSAEEVHHPDGAATANDRLFTTRLRRLGSERVTATLLLHAASWRHRTVVKVSILDKLNVRWRTGVNTGRKRQHP
jgi:hypothetical protein